ncbi:GDSL-like Lipase/Acylhydrolase [Apiospora phragmitis]|uniref:GDSL-like Lipase/Acylhydrolase n=1 Tax=Apiospora phragmitis TaxID=2905665 RepID=A0ABR1TVH4_9PEZI
MHISRCSTLLLALFLNSAAALAATDGQVSNEGGKKHWTGIWATMPQLTEPANLPPAPYNASGLVFHNATIRQTIKVALRARTIRLRLSNAFGGADLPIAAATIALPAVRNGSTGLSAIDPATLQTLTFSGGSASYTVPMGALAVTDPVEFLSGLKEGSVVTVSLYLAEGQATNLVTSHPGSRTTSYFAPGNVVSAADIATVSPSGSDTTKSADHWYFISALEAWLPRSQNSALAIVGDSITDGRGSTTNQNDRWPDQLQARLNSRSHSFSSSSSSSSHKIAILNQAAGGNRVLHDGLGPNALSRIDRDVLAQPGVRYALLFEGVNDIGTAATDPTSQHAVGTQLIAAYEQILARLHAARLPVFGATITPFCGGAPGLQPYSDPERERTRQRVNAWIRGSGRFDAVVDFDALVRNSSRPDQLRDEYNSGDYLHLNPAGYEAMGGAVDLALFDKFADGVDRMV